MLLRVRNSGQRQISSFGALGKKHTVVRSNLRHGDGDADRRSSVAKMIEYRTGELPCGNMCARRQTHVVPKSRNPRRPRAC